MTTRTIDCGSKHLVEYEVSSKKHLKKLAGKFYKESPDDFDYDIVETDKKELIGKKIYVRSAVTCCLGDKVCPRCVGRTSSTNFDIADGVSVFEAEEVTRHNLVTLNSFNCWELLRALSYRKVTMFRDWTISSQDLYRFI